MAEASETKYASEVEAFIRLVQTLGRSVAGLLVLQIAWTLLLVLAANLIKGEGGTPASAQATLRTVWFVGGLVVLLFWSLYSGLYVVLTVPLGVFMRKLASVFIFLVFDLPLLPLHWWQTTRIKEQIKEEKKRELNDPEKYEQWLGTLKADELTRSASERAAKSIANWLFVRLAEWLRTPLNSGVRIGLASIGHAHSQGGIVTAQAAAQMFGTAVPTVRLRVEDEFRMQHLLRQLRYGSAFSMRYSILAAPFSFRCLESNQRGRLPTAL